MKVDSFAHMQTYDSLQHNEPQFLTITGFKLSTFNALFDFFEPFWDDFISHYTVSGKIRRRIKTKRKDSAFPDVQTMLIFILSYMKNNPLQQTHAAAFHMTQPQANLWIHLLKNILNKALASSKCLPCRDVETLNKLLIEGQDILIDATERPIPRPGDKEVQQEFYSGKKKRTASKT
jgi:hypothetical protein